MVRDDDGYGYRELGFCPLPGLLQVIGFAEPPKSRADHWRMGCAIADRLAEFATLPELGSCQPAVIVKEAMDRGFDLCWRGTALNDPGCARVREWGRSIDGPEKAGDQAPPPPPFIEAQRRKGELRREKEFGNIMLEKIGYPIFLKHEEKIKQGMAFSAVARVIDREIQRSLKESDPDPYDIRAVARRVGAWAEGKRLPKKRPEDD